MIGISRNDVELIISRAKDQLPIEACGILAGTVSGDMTEIKEVFPMTNADRSPEHFSLDPVEQLEVCRSIRKKGLKIVGNYHSHPTGPARPSQEDIRLAYDPEAVYMIISLEEEFPVMKCFYIREGISTEIQMEITEAR